MKRKCGTCRYFEDRGTAGSGTCKHPQRKELRDVVLVRQTELACRNPYDQDLWEMSEHPVLVAADGASSGGIIPDPDIMFDLPAADHDTSGGQDTVIGTDQSGSFSDPAGSRATRKTGYSRPLTIFAPPNDDHDAFEQISSPKNSVHSAHQRLEEKRRRDSQRAHEAYVQEIGRYMDGGDATGRDHRAANAADQGLSQAKRPLEPIGVAGKDDVPDSAFLEPAIGQHNRRPGMSERNAPASRPGPTIGDASVSLPPADRVPTASQKSELDEQKTEPLPTGDVLALTQQGRQYARVPAREPFVYVDGAVRSSATEMCAAPPGPQLEVAERLDPVDRVERLATLPRCCATCRDFRQVGGGERGWCSNPYAFGERRMVQSDQLACRSSLGMWWMPNDDVWLEQADTSHHGRPTPLLDAALKLQRSGEARRDSRARDGMRRE